MPNCVDSTDGRFRRSRLQPVIKKQYAKRVCWAFCTSCPHPPYVLLAGNLTRRIATRICNYLPLFAAISADQLAPFYATNRSDGHGHWPLPWPWPWPWPLALAIGLGHWPWPLAMAFGHGLGHDRFGADCLCSKLNLHNSTLVAPFGASIVAK